MHPFRHGTILLLLVVAAVPMFGATADLVSVSTHTSPSASQGGSNHGEVLITNHSTADVRVSLAVRVVYADGTVQSITGLGDPGTLPPGGGYVLSIAFVIPPGAALGPANFIADVTATSGPLKERETSSSTFLVTP